MFFYLIRSVLFEKQLSCVFIEILSEATAWRLLGIRHAEKQQDLFSKLTHFKYKEDN